MVVMNRFVAVLLSGSTLLVCRQWRLEKARVQSPQLHPRLQLFPQPLHPRDWTQPTQSIGHFIDWTYPRSMLREEVNEQRGSGTALVYFFLRKGKETFSFSISPNVTKWIIKKKA